MNLVTLFNKFKKTLRDRSLPCQPDEIRKVTSAEDFQRVVTMERSRVNRNGGSFALIVFKLEASQSEFDLLKKLVQGIYRRTRMSDQLGWYNHHHIGLMLPETSEAGARKLVSDLYSQNINGMPKPSVDVYTYPLERQ